MPVELAAGRGLLRIGSVINGEALDCLELFGG